VGLLRWKKVSPKEWFKDDLEQIKIEWLSGREFYEILDQDCTLTVDGFFVDEAEALLYLEEVSKTIDRQTLARSARFLLAPDE
jgi:hypothetical protein